MNHRHRTDLADLEFLPPGAEVRDEPPSRLGMLLGLVIVLVFVGASLWAWVGTVDVIAIARWGAGCQGERGHGARRRSAA